MNKPFVSVVIPTYNRVELLRNCLLSFADQTYPKDKFEIIVINDGSTDNTEEMVTDLMSKFQCKLKYIKQHNQGVTRARNRGIIESEGIYIGFTSDDIIADPYWIEAAIDCFSDNDVVGVEGIIVPTVDSKITPFTHYTISLKPRRFLAANIFFKKSILDEVQRFDERFNIHVREDTDIALTVLERGYEIIFSEKVIIKHPAYMSKHWKLFKEAKNGFIEPLLYKKHKKLMSNYKKYNLERKTLVAIPYYYYGYYIAFPLLLLTMYVEVSLFFSIASFVTSYLVTLYARLRGKYVSLKDFLILVLIYLIIPYGRLYYLVKGCIYFRSFVFL